MSYLSLHKSNIQFEVVAILVVLALAIAAFTLMFVHPWFAILAFWLGMVIAATAGVTELVIRRQQRRQVRQGVATRHCPACDGTLHEEHDPDRDYSEWCCDACGSSFTTEGDALIVNG